MTIRFFPPATVVSSGTLNPADLIPSWRRYLGASCPEHLRKECLAWENNEFPDHVHDIAASELLEELDRQLNQLAPEGYYFGASEGDGSLFGFWPIEEDN